MKLKEACDIADACGLETLGEAVMNIELHSTSLFVYDEIDKEIQELESDIKSLGPDWENLSIYLILKEKDNDI